MKKLALAVLHPKCALCTSRCSVMGASEELESRDYNSEPEK